MVDAIQKLAVFNDRLKDRILIIDPAYSPALNMFDISSPRFEAYTPDQREDVQTDINALFNYIFASGEYDLTGQMGVAFSYAIRLIFARPNSTVIDLRRLLEEAPKGYLQSDFRDDIERLDPDAKAFFEHHFFSESLKTTRASIARRLHGLLAIPAFRRMFTASANGLDLFAEIQKGSIILVNTNANLLKEDGMALFGRYIIVRKSGGSVRALYNSGRQAQAGLSHHRRGGTVFRRHVRGAANAGQAISLGRRHRLPASGADARKAPLRARRQHQHQVRRAARLRGPAMDGAGNGDGAGIHPKPAEGRARPAEWSQFACHVLGYTKSAVSLTVPFFQLESEPTMTAEEHARLLERNRKRVAPAPPPVHPAQELPQSAPPASPAPIPPMGMTPNPPEKPDSPEAGGTW